MVLMEVQTGACLGEDDIIRYEIDYGRGQGVKGWAMAPKFGTSGLRGLVTKLTSDLVSNHVRSFLTACPVGRAFT